MTAFPHGRDGRPTVVVSAAALASEATALLERAGYAVVTTTAYPSEAELLDAVREFRPVALLHRQGHINGAVLDAAAPGLRVVARHGAGIDGIDIAAAKARGVTVVRAAGANSRAVAEHAWALLLSLLKDLPSIGAGMAGGKWEKTSRFTRDAEGRTIGIVGYGAIGSKVAGYAEAFGMPVLAYDPHLPGDGLLEGGLPGPGERVGSLADLLARADVLSLHCPLSAETRNMIGAAELALLPQGALLVNAARGGIVNEAALVEALDSGHLAGAGVDVFETEPLPQDSRLRNHPKVIATPHIAANTPRGAVGMATGAADGIIQVLAGRLPALKGAIVTLGEKTPLAAGHAADHAATHAA
ncbi:hydroxyacid dehydrogenase [Azospirillum melinis]|uniref:hydroxyacid dehydrogenase n=1 Tax=Azospirillum melinis TaxID=328839 RepID=UPI003756AA09